MLAIVCTTFRIDERDAVLSTRHVIHATASTRCFNHRYSNNIPHSYKYERSGAPKHRQRRSARGKVPRNFPPFLENQPQTVLFECGGGVQCAPVEREQIRLSRFFPSRLTGSSDQQLHKFLTELEHGDKTPSQILKQMRAFAGTAIRDDALRVKWLDLLPPSVRRLLKVFKASNLDE